MLIVGISHAGVAFECRGVEPVKWTPIEPLSCVSTEGNRFDDVDLSEDDWADYDDENDLSVSISELEHRFETYKAGKK